ncbi:hypothetical protein D3C85_1566760 [compost metagenome]
MSLSKLIALFNHPVTKALVDVGQYALQRHILPAVNRSSSPPTEAEVAQTADEYATDDGEDHEGNTGEDGEGNVRLPGDPRRGKGGAGRRGA